MKGRVGTKLRGLDVQVNLDLQSIRRRRGRKSNKISVARMMAEARFSAGPGLQRMSNNLGNFGMIVLGLGKKGMKS